MLSKLQIEEVRKSVHSSCFIDCPVFVSSLIVGVEFIVALMPLKSFALFAAKSMVGTSQSGKMKSCLMICPST